MAEQTMGYSADDQVILASLHKKLNPQEQQPEAPKVAEPLPGARSNPVPVNDADLQITPPDQPLEGVEAAQTQPAEGQPTEGEPALAEAPQLFKVEVVGDDGKPVEVDVDFNERKSGYMRHADYTRKTQALAKERAIIPQKLHEAERMVSEKAQSFDQALQNYEAFVMHAAAPELQGINWNQLAVENPSEHVRLTQRVNHINATLQQIRNSRAQVAKEAHDSRQKAMQETALTAKETLNREIPGGWNDDLYTKIQKGAVSHYGYLPEEIGNVVDARQIIVLNDALKWRDLQAGKPQAQQKVGQAPQLAVRPSATPTRTDQRQSAVDKARAVAQKSGSVEDALTVLQAKRARTQTR